MATKKLLKVYIGFCVNKFCFPALWCLIRLLAYHKMTPCFCPVDNFVLHQYNITSITAAKDGKL
jgi:hypothetical protein